MDRMLYTAMAGAQQSLDRQSVVSNNLANASTSGFRAQLHNMRAVPVQGDGVLATRASVAASTPGADLSRGPINATGRALDVAIQGDGWLAVQGDDGGEAYTRRGDLQVDGGGMLTSGGRPVIGENGPLVVPLGARLSVGADGTVSAIGQGQQPDAIVEVGRLKLVEAGEGEVVRGADGLFRAAAAEGGQPGELPRSEDVRVQSGALEGSNVSAVESMVSLLDNARRFEMQMKTIDSADRNAQRANGLLSLQG